MDWAGWAVFGLLATMALTAVMITAQVAGPTRLDIPLLLGSTITEDPDRARAAGFFVHLVLGQGFALGYALTFALLGRAPWWVGGLLGLLHGAVQRGDGSLDGGAPRQPSPGAHPRCPRPSSLGPYAPTVTMAARSSTMGGPARRTSPDRTR